MNTEDMKRRTKNLALRTIRMVEALPQTRTSGVIGRQILRSGTSVGANYRAACRARSRADFISRLEIVEEECDETLYWMELLVDSKQMKRSKLANLMNEAEKLLRIVVASARTAKWNRNSHSALRNPKSP